jgi:hypothetical protein
MLVKDPRLAVGHQDAAMFDKLADPFLASFGGKAIV